MHKADPESDKDCIVHRDLKPENILLTDMEGKFPTVKLIDFGTAKRFKKDENFVMDITREDFIRRLEGKFNDADDGDISDDGDYKVDFKPPVGFKSEDIASNTDPNKVEVKHSFAVGLKEKVGTLNYMAPEIICLNS